MADVSDFVGEDVTLRFRACYFAGSYAELGLDAVSLVAGNVEEGTPCPVRGASVTVETSDGPADARHRHDLRGLIRVAIRRPGYWHAARTASRVAR